MRANPPQAQGEAIEVPAKNMPYPSSVRYYEAARHYQQEHLLIVFLVSELARSRTSQDLWDGICICTQSGCKMFIWLYGSTTRLSLQGVLAGL